MIINHNMNAMNAHRQMVGNTTNSGKSMEKLSSGLRINRAGDDAAGLAISEKMRAQVRGLDQASRNGQDGISMIQTAEGALNETHSILQRMRELAVQSSNDTNVTVDRGEIQKEMDELAKEITRISNNTEFNTQKLINGGIDATGIGAAKFHVGANAGQDIELSIKAMDAKTLGVSRDTFKGTGVVDIGSASFDSSTGSKIVDAAQLTFQYTNVATATSGAVTGTAGAGAVTTGGTLNLKIDNTDVAVTIADGTSYANVVVAINAAANTALGTTGKVYASDDAGNLKITSLTTGSASSVEVVGAAGAGNSILGDLNIATGKESGLNVSKTVTISNGTVADDQVVTITDETAKAFKVSTGNYSGLSITMATGKTLADLDSTDDKVSVSLDLASATTFTSGEKTADAVTKGGLDVSTQTAASASITTIQSAIEMVSGERSKLGAYQNRLEHTIANLGTSSENLQAAESRIRDVDMAKEMMAFSKNNILSQASQAMLAQAKSQPEQVLQLLR